MAGESLARANNTELSFMKKELPEQVEELFVRYRASKDISLPEALEKVFQALGEVSHSIDVQASSMELYALNPVATARFVDLLQELSEDLRVQADGKLLHETKRHMTLVRQAVLRFGGIMEPWKNLADHIDSLMTYVDEYKKKLKSHE